MTAPGVKITALVLGRSVLRRLRHCTSIAAGGFDVPLPAGRIDDGVSLGQYKRRTHVRYGASRHKSRPNAAATTFAGVAAFTL